MEEKLLTPLELKVMQLLWSQKHAFVKDLIAAWPDDPAPKYNTVSTVVRILEEKGFVAHEAYGRSHRYQPVLSKGKYQQRLLRSVMQDVFAGSLTGMVSSLLSEKPLDEQERAALRDLIDQSDAP